jgi:hypothetical protein
MGLDDGASCHCCVSALYRDSVAQGTITTSVNVYVQEHQVLFFPPHHKVRLG